MVHLEKLEGPSLNAYLKMRRQVMKEATRINNLSWQDAWGKPEPAAGTETFDNLLPGPEAALKCEDLTYTDLGRATTQYGDRYPGMVTGENTNRINLTVPAGRIVGIHGVVQHSVAPQTVMFDVNISGREARNWPARPGQSEINDAMYFFDPIIVPGTKVLTIDFWQATAQTEFVTFLGLYAEPKA